MKFITYACLIATAAILVSAEPDNGMKAWSDVENNMQNEPDGQGSTGNGAALYGKGATPGATDASSATGSNSTTSDAFKFGSSAMLLPAALWAMV